MVRWQEWIEDSGQPRYGTPLGILLSAQAAATPGRPAWSMGDVTYEIAFDNVKVPVENRIGNEGDGMKAAQTWINANRVAQAARGLGVAQRCLEMITKIGRAHV